MIRLWSFLCTFACTALLFFSVGALIVPPLRQIPAEILIKQDQTTRGGDGIVLLMGDAVDRAPHAARLLKSGYGKYIVMVETETDELMKADLKPLEGQLVYDYLTKVLKVPEEKIIFDRRTRVSSSQEEARALMKVLDARDLHANILTTSWYHSSRAAWIFQKVQAEPGNKHLRFASFPSRLPSKWYERERDFLNVFNEYLKWPYYYVRYGLFN